MTEQSTYPGEEGSEMAVVTDERVYSFFDVVDMRAMETGKTYAMCIHKVEDPKLSGYTFHDVRMDLAPGVWNEIMRNAHEHSKSEMKMMAVLVVSNKTTHTGGTLVVRSRLHHNHHGMQFIYDNVTGTMDVTGVNLEV
jgi:hypothetical protein